MLLRSDNSKWLYLLAALSLLAILPLPYGYYVALRPIMWIGGGMVTWNLYRPTKRLTLLGWAFLIVALIYNPILPLHLDRWLWFPINLYSAGLFAWFAYVGITTHPADIDSH